MEVSLSDVPNFGEPPPRLPSLAEPMARQEPHRGAVPVGNEGPDKSVFSFHTGTVAAAYCLPAYGGEHAGKAVGVPFTPQSVGTERPFAQARLIPTPVCPAECRRHLRCGP